jgi:hypothetical protein
VRTERSVCDCVSNGREKVKSRPHGTGCPVSRSSAPLPLSAGALVSPCPGLVAGKSRRGGNVSTGGGGYVDLDAATQHARGGRPVTSNHAGPTKYSGSGAGGKLNRAATTTLDGLGRAHIEARLRARVRQVWWWHDSAFRRHCFQYFAGPA